MPCPEPRKADKMRRKFMLLFVGAAMLPAIFATGTTVLAQGGSIGGTIGKRDKVISDTIPKPHRASRAPGRPAVARFHATSVASRCPSIVGEWNSWASGMFGKRDTTFNKDGTAIHRSGIPEKWWCANGNLYLSWAGGNPGVLKLSADGRKILDADGSNQNPRFERP